MGISDGGTRKPKHTSANRETTRATRVPSPHRAPPSENTRQPKSAAVRLPREKGFSTNSLGCAMVKLVGVLVLSGQLAVAVETDRGFVERSFPNTAVGAGQLIA